MKKYRAFMKKRGRGFLERLFPPLDSLEESSQNFKKKEKGVALLIAISTLAVMMGFIADLILSSSVNLELSSSVQDKIKSEYAAKSGANLGLYLFTVTWGISLAMPQITGDPAKLEDNAGSYWNYINLLPPLGADSVKMQDELSSVLSEDVLGLRGVMNEKNREIMSLFEDNFKMSIVDEGGKINVNDCSRGRCLATLESLVALFSCPAEKAFLEDKGLTPEELAYSIKDFISESDKTSPESEVSDKNAYYAEQDPAYKAKALPFDTLNELKLVKGWDDEIHAVFSPYLTVYPINNTSNSEYSKININTASDDLLGCLVPSSLSETCRENFLRKIHKLRKDSAPLSGDDIESTLKDLMCYSPGLNSDSPKSSPKEWFGVYSKAFRLIIEGNKGTKTTKLEIVFKRLNPGEKVQGVDVDSVIRTYQVLSWHFS